MHRYITLILFCFSTFVSEGQELSSYVNPFIGTGGHGHTYPGATMPFGMVQLSPDTRLKGWDGCSAYHDSDSIIYGFSHTHLSGTGIPDYGDVLLMPMLGKKELHNGADGRAGYRAEFDKSTEKASPGYYSVLLQEDGIEVELTCSKRVGFHRYTLSPGEDSLYLILDLSHRDEVYNDTLIRHSETEIFGHRHSSAWAKQQELYFHFQSSEPYSIVKQIRGDDGEKLLLAFPGLNRGNERKELLLKVALSPVSSKKAKLNAGTEIPHWDFDRVRREANSAWNKSLSKIKVKAPKKTKELFYTALYHSLTVPNLWNDVDGAYRGIDKEIYPNPGYDVHTVFSLWDTYRATHPLYTIIERDKTVDFIRTFLMHFKTGGELPMWELASNYTYCMIGYHSVSVIADALQKGIKLPLEASELLRACRAAADRDKLGGKAYKKYNFIPAEEEAESVSKTLEYAYDDFCMSEIYTHFGDRKNSEYFLNRAGNYRNVFNPDSRHMQAKFNNSFVQEFDPYEVNTHYTEANAWQYRNYAPQDVSGLMTLMGGKQDFEKSLDSVFLAKSVSSGRHQADMTGGIGQYMHGNEPSHHMAYLYQYVNQPRKTAKILDKIMGDLYDNTPDGLSGNEDCGQMSSWYIFTALGFYPVCPGSSQYVIGKPYVEEAEINLENGNTFQIKAQGLGKRYIQSMRLHGKEYTNLWLEHEEIMRGGKLEFILGDAPVEKGKFKPPVSKLEYETPPVTYVENNGNLFSDSIEVSLGNIDEEAIIYIGYTAEEVREMNTRYSSPFVYHKSGTLYFSEAYQGGNLNAVKTFSVFKMREDLKISLQSQYSPQYAASGDRALIDGLRAKRDFRLMHWQGYHGMDIRGELQFDEVKKLQGIGVSALQNTRSWILFPSKVMISISVDGENYKSLGIIEHDIPAEDYEVRKKELWLEKEFEAKYIRFEIANPGLLPDWHLSAGEDSWLFLDEILLDE